MPGIKGNGEFISLADCAGRAPFYGVFGETITGEKHSHLAINFAYNNSVSSLRTAVTANGGGITNSAALLVASTSTASNGTAEQESLDVIRYAAGHDSYALFTAKFTTPKANSYQYIGPMITSDGFFVGYNGTSFVVGRRKSSSQTTTSTFNMDPLDGTGASQFKIDYTKLNIFRISWGYLGIAPIFFEVYGGYDTGWVTFHVMDLSNTSTGTHHDIPYLPIKVEVGNAGNTSDMSVSTGSWSGGIIGSSISHTADRHYAATSSKSITTLANVITLKNATTFASKTNRVRVSLDSLSVAATNSGSNITTVYVYKNTTLGGSPSYTDVSASDSIVSYDTAGTTLTGGILKAVYCLGNNGQMIKEYGNIDALYIYPGDILTVSAVTSAGTSTVIVGVNWSEEF